MQSQSASPVVVDHRDQVALYDLGHIQQHSPGLIHWHPNGMVVLDRLSNWILRLHQAQGYQQVRSPVLLSQHLWEQSGHWEKYQDLMFVSQAEDSRYAVKPMSCPGHIAIYAHRRRSWRELPFSMFELGHVHRREPSGALSGWMRLRGFVQDDSHVLCAQDQVGDVVKRFVDMVQQAYAAFGFSQWQWRLALRPKVRHGDDQVWDRAEEALRQACARLGIVPVEAPGEGAFYGPKLEVALVDRLGRQWQCGVAQVDFVLPQRFGLEFQDAQGQRARPVMVHHAVLGSLERWLSIVMEHQGCLPAWLSPHQVALLPISRGQSSAAHQLAAAARAQGVEVCVLEDGPLPGRVREAVASQYAQVVVLGAREVMQDQVSVRQPDGQSKIQARKDWLLGLAGQFSAPRVDAQPAALLG
jgi:threonyl-tRNA synthetase